jgi:hypothetical protein
MREDFIPAFMLFIFFPVCILVISTAILIRVGFVCRLVVFALSGVVAYAANFYGVGADNPLGILTFLFFPILLGALVAQVLAIFQKRRVASGAAK